MREFRNTTKEALKDALRAEFGEGLQTDKFRVRTDEGLVTFIRKCNSLNHPEVLTVIFDIENGEDSEIIPRVAEEIEEELFYGDVKVTPEIQDWETTIVVGV